MTTLSIFAKGFGTIGKSLLWFFSSWRHFRIGLSVLILLILTLSSLYESIEQRNPAIVIKNVGGTLAGADINIDNEVIKVLNMSENEKSGYGMFKSFVYIWANLFLIYIWFVVIFKIIDLFVNRSDPLATRYMLAFIILFIFHILYVIIIVNAGYFDGTKLDAWLQAIPFKGVVNFIFNANLWLSPVAETLTNLFGTEIV